MSQFRQNLQARAIRFAEAQERKGNFRTAILFARLGGDYGKALDYGGIRHHLDLARKSSRTVDAAYHLTEAMIFSDSDSGHVRAAREKRVVEQLCFVALNSKDEPTIRLALEKLVSSSPGDALVLVRENPNSEVSRFTADLLARRAHRISMDEVCLWVSCDVPEVAMAAYQTIKKGDLDSQARIACLIQSGPIYRRFGQENLPF